MVAHEDVYTSDNFPSYEDLQKLNVKYLTEQSYSALLGDSSTVAAGHSDTKEI